MPDPDESELSPEDDARVRSFLASAGGDEPIPDDVAARLDTRLAELVAERDAADSPAPRRAGRARVLLVAAAAVAVVGVGVPVAQNLRSGGTDFAGTPSMAQDDGSTAEEDSAGGGDALKAPGAEADLPALSTATFARDAARVLASRPRDRVSALVGPCPRLENRPDGLENIYPVSIDGTFALLEVHPVARGARLVEAVSCDGDVLASTRVPTG